MIILYEVVDLPKETENMYAMTVTTLTTFLSGLGSYNASKSVSDSDPAPEAALLNRAAQFTGYFTSFVVPRIPFITFDILKHRSLKQT